MQLIGVDATSEDTRYCEKWELGVCNKIQFLLRAGLQLPQRCIHDPTLCAHIEFDGLLSWQANTAFVNVKP